MQQENNYIPIHDEDHDRIIKGQTNGLSLEMAIYNAGYERGKAQHPAGCEWVKDGLPSKPGDYYCKCKVDGDTKKLIVEFDENGKWGEAPGYDYYEDFEIIEWLCESPSEPEQKEAVEFTPDDTAFMIDCDLYPKYDGITIKTENDEGASLSVDEIMRLSDVLRRYAILFKQQKEK